VASNEAPQNETLDRRLNVKNWEFWRTDVLGVYCVGVVFYCVIEKKYPAVVVAALLVAAFCAMYPRVKLTVTKVDKSDAP
jgi:hypothetical protein